MKAPLITARCHPDLLGLIPEPQPARAMLPDWLEDMPAEVTAETLGGIPVRTVKHCPPFLDALSLGLMIPLPCDLEFRDGQVSWDWELPAMAGSLIARAPVSLHAPEQATGVPWRLAVNSILKFLNFWTLEVPEGWSLLCTHPMNREELPFRTLSGVVDCDRFHDGYVHFPALWLQPDFTGILPAGTPVAQVIPLPRTTPNLQIAAMTEEEIRANRDLQEMLNLETGIYQRDFRH